MVGSEGIIECLSRIHIIRKLISKMCLKLTNLEQQLHKHGYKKRLRVLGG